MSDARHTASAILKRADDDMALTAGGALAGAGLGRYLVDPMVQDFKTIPGTLDRLSRMGKPIGKAQAKMRKMLGKKPPTLEQKARAAGKAIARAPEAIRAFKRVHPYLAPGVAILGTGLGAATGGVIGDKLGSLASAEDRELLDDLLLSKIAARREIELIQSRELSPEAVDRLMIHNRSARGGGILMPEEGRINLQSLVDSEGNPVGDRERLRKIIRSNLRRANNPGEFTGEGRLLASKTDGAYLNELMMNPRHGYVNRRSLNYMPGDPDNLEMLGEDPAVEQARRLKDLQETKGYRNEIPGTRRVFRAEPESGMVYEEPEMTPGTPEEIAKNRKMLNRRLGRMAGTDFSAKPVIDEAGRVTMGDLPPQTTSAYGSPYGQQQMASALAIDGDDLRQGGESAKAYLAKQQDDIARNLRRHAMRSKGKAALITTLLGGAAMAAGRRMGGFREVARQPILTAKQKRALAFGVPAAAAALYGGTHAGIALHDRYGDKSRYGLTGTQDSGNYEAQGVATALPDEYFDPDAMVAMYEGKMARDMMAEGWARPEGHKTASTLVQNFAAGVDPLGIYSGLQGYEAERERLPTSEHAKKLTASAAGGLVGGALITPPLLSGVTSAASGAMAAKGGLKGKAMGAVKGFAKGVNDPFQYARHASRVNQVREAAQAGGKVVLSPDQARSLRQMVSRMPGGDVDANVYRRLMRVGERGLTVRADDIKALDQPLRDMKAQAIAGAGIGAGLQGIGAASQYQQGRESMQRVRRDLAETPGGEQDIRELDDLVTREKMTEALRNRKNNPALQRAQQSPLTEGVQKKASLRPCRKRATVSRTIVVTSPASTYLKQDRLF